MKIQLTYDRPAEVNADLLVVILDSETLFHDLSGSPIDEIVRRVARDFADKRLKTDYFTALDSRGPARNLAIYSTSLISGFNVWEDLNICVTRALELAKDHGFSRSSLALNTEAAVPFIGKAVEGALIGGYTFDRYKREKNVDKTQINIVGLKAHDQQNRHYLSRYTVVSEAVNEARNAINE